MLRNV
jgi:hypothetical protein